ncbi:MAG: hypothetical protein ACLQAT_13605 [Candidatus Binataceae bacterium]
MATIDGVLAVEVRRSGLVEIDVRGRVDLVRLVQEDAARERDWSIL